MPNRGTISFLTVTVILMTSVQTVALGSCVQPYSGLVSWWPCDNDASDIQDGNDGVEMNGIAPGVLGMVQGAFSLDGEDDYVEIPNAPNLNPVSQITVAAWFYTESFSGNGNNSIVDKGYLTHSDPYYQYHLGVIGDLRPPSGSYPGSFIFTVAIDGTPKAAKSPNYTWSPGNWYLVAGTYDGSYVRLYVNGAVADSISASGSMTDYGKPVRIGAFSNLSTADSYTPGLIDEVMILDRALSGPEIEGLYNAGSAGMCKPYVAVEQSTWGRLKAMYK